MKTYIYLDQFRPHLCSWRASKISEHSVVRIVNVSLPCEKTFRSRVSKRRAEVTDLILASLHDEGQLVRQGEYQVGFVQGISHV